MEALADTGARRLYRDIPPGYGVVFYETVVEPGLVPIRAPASADGWHLRTRFPHRGSIASFGGLCEGAGVAFMSGRACESGYATDSTLTGTQRLAVTVARDGGYYSGPRECDSRTSPSDSESRDGPPPSGPTGPRRARDGASGALLTAHPAHR